MQTLRFPSLSDRLSDYTAAWIKLGIWSRKEETVYKTAIFRVRVHTVLVCSFTLYLRGGCDRVGPFWRKGRSYLHFPQEADKRRPASCE